MSCNTRSMQSQRDFPKAAAYVEIIICQGRHFWGVGVDEDIIKSSIAALVSAANKMAKKRIQDAVKAARMKKARRLLKESNQTVESIAASVGYENVEHFNRLFKRRMR